ncbi:MAG: amidohydrolase family protein [Burkholderiaceae bacterium]
MSPDTTPPPACDCHIHIYDLKRHPLPQAHAFGPPDAPWTAHQALQRDLGLERCVIVQPMGYGLDNRCTLETLAAANGSARAIIALQPGADAATLRSLDEQGVRGVRFMMVPGGGSLVTWEMLPQVAHEIAGLGWNINLQLDGREIHRYAGLLANLPCPVVIDHNGKFLEPVTTDDASYLRLCGLMDTGRFWVKLSAPYETSRVGPPSYEDVSAIARDLARRYPERCLWASNWPHPGQLQRPDNAGLLALLDDWAPSATVKERILRWNPQELYGF